MAPLIELWPVNSMNLKDIMAALNRAFDNPKAASRGPARKFVEAGEAPPATRQLIPAQDAPIPSADPREQGVPDARYSLIPMNPL